MPYIRSKNNMISSEMYASSITNEHSHLGKFNVDESNINLSRNCLKNNKNKKLFIYYEKARNFLAEFYLCFCFLFYQ